jgi:hypothetical protein
VVAGAPASPRAGRGVGHDGAVSDDLAFTCPRCAQQVSARFYGPCPSCRDELRVRFQGEATTVEVAAYEPKVNVTPNAVALKDD